MRFEIKKIPLEKLYISKYNVRRKYDPAYVVKLAKSILARGQVLENLVVIPDEEGRYGIIVGGMRYRALLYIKENYPEDFERLGLGMVDCKVVYDISPVDAMLLSLSENLDRKNISEEEVAEAVCELERMGISEEEIAKRLARSVAELERVFKLARALSKVKVTISSPGRPPKVGKKGVPALSAVIADTLASQLKLKKYERDNFVKKFVEGTKGMNVKTVQIVAKKIREKGPEELDKILKEFKEHKRVSMVISIRKDIIEKIDKIAKDKNATRDEVIEELLQLGLNHYKM